MKVIVDLISIKIAMIDITGKLRVEEVVQFDVLRCFTCTTPEGKSMCGESDLWKEVHKRKNGMVGVMALLFIG